VLLSGYKGDMGTGTGEWDRRVRSVSAVNAYTINQDGVLIW